LRALLTERDAIFDAAVSEILADDKLRKVFGKAKVTMFEMNKHLAGHLK
jgi:chromatin remodeling complex protein RSC6